MEEERLQALEMEREKEEERLREEYELKEHLRQQMMELKNREAEVRYTKWKMERDLCSVSTWKGGREKTYLDHRVGGVRQSVEY